ncbi:MAG: SAM-dependent methyltransferase [Bacteroidota bacterium]
MTGKLFLVPSYLSGDNDLQFLTPQVLEVVSNCSHYFVENTRSARRFISSLGAGIVIDDLSFYILDKNSSWDDMYPLFDPIREGMDMAIISEAGVPCLADPGNIAVTFAHQTGIRVVPIPGASSIQLALIASGFNGQQFTFHGYLPIDKAERRKKIQALERSARTGHTQLFMETPYRNQKLLEDLLHICIGTTLLSIAADVTGSREKISTKSIAQWKSTRTDIHKIPAIFSFGQFP